MNDEELEASIVELEREVQRQEDVEEIKRLHCTYIRQLADRDWSDMLDHFTDDAVVDLRHHGGARAAEDGQQRPAASRRGAAATRDITLRGSSRRG